MKMATTHIQLCRLVLESAAHNVTFNVYAAYALDVTNR